MQLTHNLFDINIVLRIKLHHLNQFQEILIDVNVILNGVQLGYPCPTGLSSTVLYLIIHRE